MYHKIKSHLDKINGELRDLHSMIDQHKGEIDKVTYNGGDEENKEMGLDDGGDDTTGDVSPEEEGMEDYDDESSSLENMGISGISKKPKKQKRSGMY